MSSFGQIRQAAVVSSESSPWPASTLSTECSFVYYGDGILGDQTDRAFKNNGDCSCWSVSDQISVNAILQDRSGVWQETVEPCIPANLASLAQRSSRPEPLIYARIIKAANAQRSCMWLSEYLKKHMQTAACSLGLAFEVNASAEISLEGCAV